MRFIPAKYHGMLDYAVALTLIAGPFILGFVGMAKLIAVAGGIGLFIYSMITNYSVSVQKILPFSVHLIFDFVAAIALIAAPFLFGFNEMAKYFYLIIGIAVVVVVAVTHPNGASAPMN